MNDATAGIQKPDPLYFQQASMLMLTFRFKGTRKVMASRLMATSDFLGELEAHLPVLDQVYSDYTVNAVEIVSYQRGAFFYDPWPDGLKRAREYQLSQGKDVDDEQADDLEGSLEDAA
jgi:hypothetical protein